MILEGRQKMGSPEAGINRMDGQIVHEMFHEQIAISRDGAEYLGQCVQQNKGWVLRIGHEEEGQQNVRRHKISLADPHDRVDFMGAILRIPPSPGVVRRISKKRGLYWDKMSVCYLPTETSNFAVKIRDKKINYQNYMSNKNQNSACSQKGNINPISDFYFCWSKIFNFLIIFIEQKSDLLTLIFHSI